MKFKEMPALMKEQKENGKKDRYIEITNLLIGAAEQDLEREEKICLMQALIETLEYMDVQIYELYRALSDCFKKILRELLADYTELSEEERQSISETVKRACAIRILLKEKYEAYIL